MDIESIFLVAKRVRAWAAARAKRRGINPDLMGMCAIASGKLMQELKAAGIEACQIALNDDHAFVLVDREFVVDVTATQFGDYDPVMVLPLRDKMESWWEPTILCDSVRSARRVQKEYGWCESQWIPESLARPAKPRGAKSRLCNTVTTD